MAAAMAKKRDACRKALAAVVDPAVAHAIETQAWLTSKSSTAPAPDGNAAEAAVLCYENKILQLLHNLRLNGDYLVRTYTPEVLVWLDDAALAVGTKYEHLSRQATDHVQRLQTVLDESMKHTTTQQPKVPEPASTFLRCRKCKSTDVGFNQKQTRAGDEGMTSFCRCNQCGTTWKM